MSDCNHERIKCMVCHRDVGIHDQNIPDNIAVARIQELESQVKQLEEQVKQLKNQLNTIHNVTRGKRIKGYPGMLKIQGHQHEIA